jgi:hypothetical protein
MEAKQKQTNGKGGDNCILGSGVEEGIEEGGGEGTMGVEC